MMYAKVITAADMRSPVNLSSAAFATNKYATYRWLREHDPVHQGKVLSLLPCTFLSRYDDCARALRDPRLVRNRTTATGGRRFPVPMPRSVQALVNSMIMEDGAEHRRLRDLVHKAFTPRAIGQLAGRIEAITAALLDDAPAQGEIELKSAFARPIPVTVIAEMVGVEVAEVPRMASFIEAMTEGMSGFGYVRTLVWDLPKGARYVRELIARKQQHPGDDILTGLIQAEADGDRLTEDELVAMVFLLIIAGHETTFNLIANAVVTLLAHPEQLALLRAEPHRLDAAIEEVLRYNGPVQTTKPMYPTEDVTFSGVTIPRGATMMPLLGSANHDPAAFEQPEVFDITREKTKHLSFGHGIHYCLGAPLARLETRIALQALLARSPNLRLAVPLEALEIEVRPGWHTYKAVPVVVG
ncbi:MAG: cytochrome P450 [Alphaproteobacteria bacterium]|nr:cytochrome P450 [Alphaproteobacteria bacterium]